MAVGVGSGEVVVGKEVRSISADVVSIVADRVSKVGASEPEHPDRTTIKIIIGTDQRMLSGHLYPLI